MKKILIFIYLLLNLTLFAEEFPYNPHVSVDTWTLVEPYFLPFNHPMRKKLDRLFSKQRVTESPKTFEKAGFGHPKLRQPTNIIVGRHLDFSHYLFKVYLDSQPPLEEWRNWIQRIEGAKAIQACIDKHGFKHFIVPKKWIYPLPLHPSPSDETIYHRKNFILIVEEMPLLSHKENKEAFQKKMTPQILDELFILFTELGLIDSVYIDNIPFTKTGKIAFIDTEHHHAGKVPYHKITHSLNPKMQRYWENLIQNQ